MSGKTCAVPLKLSAAIAALILAGCGGASHTTPVTSTTTAHAGPAAVCAPAQAGHGAPGACEPKQKLGLTGPHPPPTAGQILYPDLSNNDPCVCGQSLRARGYRGLIVKANQGTGFIDGWAVPMIQSARAAGLTVGMYDFDQDYTVAEAQLFVSRAHAAGIYPNTPNTFPLYLDVEYGNFNYGGLLAQIAYIRSQGYRVGIYTGQWYWGPHAGCRWPTSYGVTAWLSGYPNAPVPCGTTGYNSHQFTSTPIDVSIWLGDAAGFTRFVSAGPPPPPADRYAIMDHTKRHFVVKAYSPVFGAPGQVTASEYGTMTTEHRFDCHLGRPRRAACRSSASHLHLLADRLQYVVRRYHHGSFNYDHARARNRIMGKALTRR